MLIRELWSYQQGYVIIKIKGRGIEEFLNRASQQGIYLWEVQRLSGELAMARVSVSDFRRMRKVVRSVSVTVRIRQKVGLPFICHRLNQRLALMIGALLGLLCICLLSSVIWFVQIQGIQQLDQALITEVLKIAGVEPGVWRSSVDPRELEKYLMLNLPQLAWVGVRLRGTLLEVTIVEKVEVPVDERVPGDIVAGKNALVTQIIPFAGRVRVEEGEAVTEGQILIDGSLDAYESPGQGVGGRYLRAAGVIKGRVWYRGFGEARLVSEISQRTGQTCTGHQLSVGPWRWHWGVSMPSFPLYEEEVKVQRPTLARFNWELPIEFRTIDYYELETYKMETDLEVAKEMVLHQSWEAIQARLTPGVEILSDEVEIITEDHNGDILVRARRIVEVHEEIGVFRALYSKEAKEIGEGSH